MIIPDACVQQLRRGLCAGLITLALGLGSWSLAGLYCNHADLSPRHAPILLGLTNTGGAVPGILGVAITGLLLDSTGLNPLLSTGLHQ